MHEVHFHNSQVPIYTYIIYIYIYIYMVTLHIIIYLLCSKHLINARVEKLAIQIYVITHAHAILSIPSYIP